MKDKASGFPAEAGLVMRHPGCDVVQRQNYGVITLSWECSLCHKYAECCRCTGHL